MSFSRRFSTIQLPSGFRCATPVNAPRATSAPILLNVTRSLSILPSISTLVVGTSFSVNELALSWICALLPSIFRLQGSGDYATVHALRTEVPLASGAVECHIL